MNRVVQLVGTEAIALERFDHVPVSSTTIRSGNVRSDTG